MRKVFITAIFVLTTAFLFAQDEVFKAAWITVPVKIDGKGDEWTNPLRYYDADTKLSFAFSNDDKNLYLCFQTNDNLNEMKIMHAGMEISLNIKGGNTAIINFPLPQNAGQPEQQNENDGLKSRDESNKEIDLMKKNTMMEVKGFATKNGLISINDSSGINAAIRQDPGDKFTCELAIPFKELFGANYSAADILKRISLVVKINAMKGAGQSKKSNPINNNFAAKNRGSGRPGGGVHRNNGGNPGEVNTEELKEDKTDVSRKTEFKQKFMLAQKQPS
ncbi:MAG: hypothetical protein ABI402_18435 [Ferruginibacter sp.]